MSPHDRAIRAFVVTSVFS